MVFSSLYKQTTVVKKKFIAVYYGHIQYKLQKQNKTLVTDPPLKNKKQKTQNCNPVKLNEYLPSIYFYSN